MIILSTLKKNIAVLADLSHHTSMFMFISEMVTQDHCKTTAQIRVSSYVSTQRFFFFKFNLKS